MSVPDYQEQNRNRFLESAIKYGAQEKGFLSAVFFVSYFNRIVNPRNQPGGCADINPSEVFDDYDQDEFRRALEKAGKLIYTTHYVGEAARDYKTPKAHADAMIKMKFNNPGFDEECYNMVSGLQIRNSR